MISMSAEDVVDIIAKARDMDTSVVVETTTYGYSKRYPIIGIDVRYDKDANELVVLKIDTTPSEDLDS